MTDNYERKLADLARAISKKTLAGEIDWQPVPEKRNTYAANVGQRRLTFGYVRYETPEDGETLDAVIEVYDGDRVVETIRDPMLGAQPVLVAGYSGWFALMNEALKSIERRILGSEQAIDELLIELDDEIPF